MWTLVLRVGILFCLAGLCSSRHHHGYLTNYYNAHRPIVVNDSMILELTNRFLTDDPTDNFISCNVMVTTTTGRRIALHFLSLEISNNDKTVDRLFVYDYKKNGEAVLITPPQGLYGIFNVHYHGRSRGVDDFLSSGSKLKLDYQGHPTLAYDGFKILITTFRDSTGDCGRGYFLCKRKRICIPSSTWCDGFRNCGNDDDTDESNCYIDPTGGWHPLDGTIMAVVAASLSCSLLLMTIVIVFYVLRKMDKMDLQKRSISVYFRRKSPKRQVSHNGELMRMYAPPSYDVVVGMDEQPPPYQSDDSSGSDVEDVAFIEQVASCSCANQEDMSSESTDNIRNKQIAKSKSKPTVRVTSAVVVCDIEGNNLPSCSKVDDEDPSLLKQTHYHLTSSAPSYERPAQVINGHANRLPGKNINGLSNGLQGKSRNSSANGLPCKIINSHSNGHLSSEIEVISSGDDDSGVRDVKRMKKSRSDGDVKRTKINGHARVNYARSPSREADSARIEFINNEHADQVEA